MTSSIPLKFSQEIIDCFLRGGKILICGNGGSAAESQHFAAELIGHFELPRRALPAIALTTDTSIITAVGNDDGYDKIFSRQIEALGTGKDILFILTTSGKSKNCLEAEVTARNRGMKVRFFPMRESGETTAKCQEKHLKLIHDICRLVDNYYADTNPTSR